MNWILYIIMGAATQPSLQQLQTYRDEAVCIARETAKVTQ